MQYYCCVSRATLGASASMSNKYEQHDDTQDELERNIKNVVLERVSSALVAFPQ
jgi:hypothetical protein